MWRLSLPQFDDGDAIDYDRSAGWSSLVARWAHNPKVGGSNPPPATNLLKHHAFAFCVLLCQLGQLCHLPQRGECKRQV